MALECCYQHVIATIASSLGIHEHASVGGWVSAASMETNDTRVAIASRIQSIEIELVSTERGMASK